MPDLLTRLKKQHVAGDFIDNILVAFPTSRSPNVSRQSRRIVPSPAPDRAPDPSGNGCSGTFGEKAPEQGNRQKIICFT
jgi:hypothetical protein